MNIMIITDRDKDNIEGQRFIVVGFDGDAQSSLLPFFELDN
jgi:hypothetical protein